MAVGAYEYLAGADLSNDGRVDMADLRAFHKHFHEAGSHADVNRDGRIDLLDAAEFKRWFFAWFLGD